MVALVILLLILAVFGAAGFAVHLLWLVLVAAVVLWILGFFVGGVESAEPTVDAGTGRRRRHVGVCGREEPFDLFDCDPLDL